MAQNIHHHAAPAGTKQGDRVDLSRREFLRRALGIA